MGGESILSIAISREVLEVHLGTFLKCPSLFAILVGGVLSYWKGMLEGG